MAQTALVNPQLTINNISVRYVEGSLVYNDGFGEVNIRVHTAGPGDIEKIESRDINTQFGMVKFQLLSTQENAEIMRAWLADNDSGVPFGITLSDGSFNRSFANVIITNNPDNNTGNDGNIDIEFATDRAA